MNTILGWCGICMIKLSRLLILSSCLSFSIGTDLIADPVDQEFKPSAIVKFVNSKGYPVSIRVENMNNAAKKNPVRLIQLSSRISFIEPFPIPGPRLTSLAHK